MIDNFIVMNSTPLHTIEGDGDMGAARGQRIGDKVKLLVLCVLLLLLLLLQVVYQAEFTPPRDAFATVRIPSSAFRLVKRSVPISGPPLGITTIYQMGLVLSKFSFGEDD